MAIIYGKDSEKQPDEFGVLEKLSQLSDDYHILCDLNITLLNYVKYNGTKNLGSAQIDFVIVSKKGIVLIQAKDWSALNEKQENDVNPHEEVDKAGKVLWLTLKPLPSTKNPHVTSLLLTIQGNIKYDPKYKFVLVSDLKKINRLFKNRKAEFSEREVNRMVDLIKNYVTK
jgi:hypothetical protein